MGSLLVFGLICVSPLASLTLALAANRKRFGHEDGPFWRAIGTTLLCMVVFAAIATGITTVAHDLFVDECSHNPTDVWFDCVESTGSTMAAAAALHVAIILLFMWLALLARGIMQIRLTRR